jgi:hypothetical protein
MIGVLGLGTIRATITLDEFYAMMVRQRFGGNLSRGINEMLKKCFAEEKKDDGFGLLKGKTRVSAKDVIAMRREDEKAHEKLYR